MRTTHVHPLLNGKIVRMRDLDVLSAIDFVARVNRGIATAELMGADFNPLLAMPPDAIRFCVEALLKCSETRITIEGVGGAGGGAGVEEVWVPTKQDDLDASSADGARSWRVALDFLLKGIAINVDPSLAAPRTSPSVAADPGAQR